MDVYQPERRRKGRARERYSNRQRRMAVPLTETPSLPEERPITSRAPHEPRPLPALIGRAHILFRDALWYLRHSRIAFIGVVGVAAAVILLFLGTYVLGGRVFPNVWALGVNVGGMTVDEAAAALQSAWANDVRFQLVDEERVWSATPAQLGISIDARATAESARGAGLTGLPFGRNVLPTVSIDELTAQDFLLDLTETSKILPYNAGYRWEGDRLVGVPGTDGRFLDIGMTLASLEENLALVADTRRLDLVMTAMPPDVRDPTPYLDQARAFASRQFIMHGYDPFLDERISWTTDRDTLTTWLEAGEDGLSLREDTFGAFVDVQTSLLQQTNTLRYLEPNDTIAQMQEAINEGFSEVYLRIRYQSSTYTVVSGDTGYRIATKNGIPFYQLQMANPGRDWEVNLEIGETVNLPSRDITVPLQPVPDKRIVVNLDTQYLVAYQNGEPVFEWSISSGMDRAPTYPGIFQILNHDPSAIGGSYELCNSYGCGQWTMNWFMGIYEVVPGLVNGFHGGVLLPNGSYLGGGNVGRPYTYGCIMSLDENALALYDWAEVGTMVEIINSQYQPVSAVARQMLETRS
jgi:LysM repeat protein